MILVQHLYGQVWSFLNIISLFRLRKTSLTLYSQIDCTEVTVMEMLSVYTSVVNRKHYLHFIKHNLMY